ncbi:hypothetical protein CTL2C_952 [Chlamydia trachomatis L2c]|nr:hypothetical protein CTL2C_952 [Chlamydia trachomatis L2c]
MKFFPDSVRMSLWLSVIFLLRPHFLPLYFSPLQKLEALSF